MRDHLDRQLVETYPEIFRDRHAPMHESAMAWGMACGDGWYALLDTCCALITADVTTLRRDIAHCTAQLAAQEQMPDWDRTYYTPERLQQLEDQLRNAVAQLPVAAQVKEKFGGLRFYVDGGTDAHHHYIRFAEAMSYRTCEACGATATAKARRDGWIQTLCDPCAATVQAPQ